MGDKPDLAYYLRAAQKRNLSQQDIIDLFKKTNVGQQPFEQFRDALKNFERYVFKDK